MGMTLFVRRRSLGWLVATVATALVIAGSAEAALFRATAKPPRAITVTKGDPAISKFNVSTKFSSIDSVCFHFEFAGDLLDPGDELWITPVEKTIRSQSGPGFFNPSGAAQAERTLCIVAGSHDHLLSFFLDGKEKLELSMPSGSVTIESLQVTIDGVPR